MSVFEGTDAGSKVGLEIWRIEAMKPVKMEAASFGNFHSGDCYLVLHSYTKGSNRTLQYDLHFWQGKDSSQDERGASALRTIELDDFLGGKPVQHREVQEHESALFMSLFPKGIKYLEGGVESGFRHVDPNVFTTRLFHIKGARVVRCLQVELSAKSLNQGDVFVLDAGLTIYQWNGESASRGEKFKALEMATKIKDSERGGKAKLVFLESNTNNDDSAAFFKLLNGSPADVRSADDGGSDAAVKTEPASLWRVSDASGSMQVDEVARGQLERAMLDQNDVFLLDGGGEVFVWLGKNATKEERAKGMTYASEYLTKAGKPAWTPLTRLPGGGETPAFKSFFTSFDKEPTIPKEEDYVAKERKVVMAGLLAKQKQAEDKLLGDANSSITVWRIENLEAVQVPAEKYGQFGSGDSFIVLLKYRNGNLDSYVLYMWQGRDSTSDEKAACALRTVEIAGRQGELPGAQVRVVQGKEPRSFLALFKGKMVVRFGGVAGAGGFAKSSSSSSGDIQLYHIKGTDGIDTRAVEVSASASSLNSGDCFVLVTPEGAQVWQGNGSNGDERATAAAIAKSILAGGRAVTEVSEGSETDAFWGPLGGKAEYANQASLQEGPSEARLFEINGVTGDFHAEEVFNFSQDDLDQNSVFLLDTVTDVAVWIGRNSRDADKKAALQMAENYVNAAPDGRSKDCAIARIDAGAEPPTFTAHFLGWSTVKANDFADPYQKKLQLLQSQADSSSSSSSSSSAPAAAKVAPSAAAPAAAAASGGAGPFYTLDQLKAGPIAGVEASKKENYLSDADFLCVLGTDRASFAKLAGWKQADIKKKAGIF